MSRLFSDVLPEWPLDEVEAGWPRPRKRMCWPRWNWRKTADA